MPSGDAIAAPDSGRGCVCVDGRLLAPERARVSALDAGLLLGDGLFESLRAQHGVPYLLDRHLDRLLAAVRKLRFAGVPSRTELSTWVRRTLERSRLQDAYVRITVTRGSSLRALSAASGPATVVVAALPAPARSTAPLRTASIAAAAAVAATAKSTSRQPSVLARIDVERRGAQEGLYVSAAGRVLEGISSNLFVCVDGRLLTPPSDECLPGITRGRILELARGAGIAASERPIDAEVLLGAGAAFLTNAVQGLREIGTLDGRAPAGRERDGVFATLLRLYESDRAASAASPSAA